MFQKPFSSSPNYRSARQAVPPLALALLGLSACGQGTSEPGTGTKSGAASGFQASSDAADTVDADNDGAATSNGIVDTEEPRELDETDRPSVATTKLTAKDLRPELRAVNYEGDLCPPDSLTVNTSGDGSAFSIVFSTDLQAIDDSIEGHCQVRLGLAVPKGSSFGNVYLYGSGFTAATSGGANLKVDYGFAGDDAKQTLAHTFANDEDAYAIYKVMDQVSSPTCGSGDSASETELVLDITGAASGDAYFRLGTLEFGVSYVDGARWMNCKDRTPLVPAPSEEDEPCAGPPRHACAEGLECDIFDSDVPYDDLLTGVCAKAGTRLEPMPTNGPCNGIRDIQCDQGLICHYTTAARAATKSWNGSANTARLVGMCQPSVGRASDPCAGYPNIECDAGHFCSDASGDVCKATDGQLGSACEEGIAGCSDKLVCQNLRCAVPMAGEGDACGGPLAIRCIGTAVCDAELERCVADPNQGVEGSACDDADDCHPELVCYGHVCRASVKGLKGTSCEQHEDCNAGLYCNESNLCWTAEPGQIRGACYEGISCGVGLACVDDLCVPKSVDEMESEVAPPEPLVSSAP